jgi:hypothetical protein
MPQIVEERPRCLKCQYLAGDIAPPAEPEVVADVAELEALAS